MSGAVGTSGIIATRVLAAPESGWRERIRCRSLLGDVDGVVVGDAVDELVVGVDAGARGQLVDDDFEGLVVLREPLLLEIERLFFVLLAGEDADVDQSRAAAWGIRCRCRRP